MTRSLFLLLPLLVACGEEGGETSRVDDILALTGDATAGATVYADNCASCHGTDATGGSGPAIAGMGETEEMAEVILEGEGDMTAFDGVISDQDIADVIAYVQSLYGSPEGRRAREGAAAFTLLGAA